MSDARSLAPALAGFVLACQPVAPPLTDQPPMSTNDKDGDPDSSNAGFSKTDFLNSVASVVSAAAVDFESKAKKFNSAALALSAENTEATLAKAQDAWKAAMQAWQKVEVMQIGPAAVSSQDPGGKDLRDEIYSWPLLNNPCRVDQELESEGYLTPDFHKAQLINVYGLDAAEYLLFYSDTKNSCPPQVDINVSGSWSAIDADTLTARRAKYVAVVANGILDTATTLRKAWSEGGKDRAFFTAPGKGSSPYASENEAIDQVFRSIFFVDTIVKDRKLAAPLGLDGSCVTETCPAELEFQWSKTSREAIAANLEGLGELYRGGKTAEDGVGFDEYLQAQDGVDVTAKFEKALAAAQAEVASESMSLAKALADKPKSVTRIYDSIKAVTDILKGEFVLVLQLEIPDEGAGDAD